MARSQDHTAPEERLQARGNVSLLKPTVARNRIVIMRHDRCGISNYGLVRVAAVLFMCFSAIPAMSEQSPENIKLYQSGTLEDIKKAVAEGLNFIEPFSGMVSPLMVAAASNKDPKVILYLIDVGSDINAQDSNGKTPVLYAACGSKYPGIVQALLKAGAEPSHPSVLLANAVADNSSLEMITYLFSLQNSDVRTKSENGGNLLLLAAMNPNIDVFKILLGKGLDIRAKDPQGNNAIAVAAARNTNPSILRVILGAGGELNVRNKEGKTALMIAASENADPEMIKALVKLGLGVKTLSPEGLAALQYAAYFNTNPKVLEAIVSVGGDLKMTEKDGRTLLMGAAIFNENPDIVTWLVENGAQIDARDNAGMTALMHAAMSGTNEIIVTLVELGADITLKDDQSHTAYNYAELNDRLHRIGGENEERERVWDAITP
jgi:ankyrin repeat protein